MRYSDWQQRFWKALDARRTENFSYGVYDCVLFAAAMADSISDANYAKRATQAFRWRNSRDALRLIEGKELRELIEVVMGPIERWQYMSMGDMVLINDEAQQQSLCIHDGCQLIGPDQVGFKVIPMRYAIGGWRVS